MIKHEFPGRHPESEQGTGWSSAAETASNEGRVERARQELALIDVSAERLASLSPEELIRLNDHMAELKGTVRPEDLHQAVANITALDMMIPAENLRALPPEDLRARLEQASATERDAILRRLEIMETSQALEDTAREYFRKYPGGAIQRELQGGDLSQAGARNLKASAWSLRNDVNLMSPTTRDIDRFFSLKRFALTAIEGEMLDREQATLSLENSRTAGQVAAWVEDVPPPATDKSTGKARLYTVDERRQMAEEKIGMIRSFLSH